MFAFAIAACGTDEPPDNNTPDAPGTQSTVMEVVPCAGETMTIESTGGFRFSPSTATIASGQIIKFVNGGSHNVIPVNSDSGLNVGFGATKCLRFTAAGSFNFRCQPHPSMTGTITVN
jgi:plastocyanin